MPTLVIDDQWIAGPVRVRASAADPFAGLRGHDYIAARKLNPPIPRLDPNREAREAAALNILTQRGAIAPAPFPTPAPDGLNRRFWVLYTKK